MTAEPELRQGFAVWARDSHGVRTAFVGRGPSADRRAALAAASPDRELPRLAWPRQVHSAQVLIARPGECGEGDALVTSESGLAVASPALLLLYVAHRQMAKGVQQLAAQEARLREAT